MPYRLRAYGFISYTSKCHAAAAAGTKNANKIISRVKCTPPLAAAGLRPRPTHSPPFSSCSFGCANITADEAAIGGGGGMGCAGAAPSPSSAAASVAPPALPPALHCQHSFER